MLVESGPISQLEVNEIDKELSKAKFESKRLNIQLSDAYTRKRRLIRCISEHVAQSTEPDNAILKTPRGTCSTQSGTFFFQFFMVLDI